MTNTRQFQFADQNYSIKEKKKINFYITQHSSSDHLSMNCGVEFSERPLHTRQMCRFVHCPANPDHKMNGISGSTYQEESSSSSEENQY